MEKEEMWKYGIFYWILGFMRKKLTNLENFSILLLKMENFLKWRIQLFTLIELKFFIWFSINGQRCHSESTNAWYWCNIENFYLANRWGISLLNVTSNCYFHRYVVPDDIDDYFDNNFLNFCIRSVNTCCVFVLVIAYEPLTNYLINVIDSFVFFRAYFWVICRIILLVRRNVCI